MGHHMKHCPACNIIWEQCRCFDANKTKIEEKCPTCKTRGVDCKANPETKD